MELLKNYSRVNTNIYKNIFPDNTVLNIDYIESQKENILYKEKIVKQDNHGFVLYDVIYFDIETNKYKKAIANSKDIEIYGIVCNVVNKNCFEVAKNGMIKYKKLNISDTSILYLSDKNAGKIVHYQEIKNKYYIPIGMYTNESLVINIQDKSFGLLEPYPEELEIESYTKQEISDIIQELKESIL